MNKYFKKLVKWTNIKILDIKKCIYCGSEFPIFDIEKKMLEKHWFKDTKQCSTCTFRMLDSYLNDKHLYIRKDSETEKSIISILSDDYKWKVIDAKNYKKYIIDDLWLDFWKNIGKDIFKDFGNLYNDFPKPSRLIYPWLENADYSSHVWWAKNLYLSYCVFVDCEDIYYSSKILSSCKIIFNSYNIFSSSNIYYSMVLWNCHNVSYGKNSVDSSNLIFCTDMNNCFECIFCCNQVNSKYKIFNKEYKKEEYLEIKENVLNRFKNYNEFKKLEKNYYRFLEENYVSSSINMNNTEKVVWEEVFYSYNTVNAFCCNWIKDSVNIFNIWDDMHDHNVNLFNSIEAWTNCENFVWACSVWMNTFNIFFSKSIIEAKYIYYSIDIEWCEEIMFSVWLKNKKYCILNKQYKKEKYFELKQKIIEDLKDQGKWWNYFGFELSPYPYNDTLAYDYFKVNKVIYADWTEKIIDKNARWIVSINSNDFISDAELDLWWEKKLKIKWRTKNKYMWKIKKTF